MPERDMEVVDKLNELAQKHPTRGFASLYGRIRNEGIEWNHKRVKRVYKLLGMNLKRKRKRRLPQRVKEPLEDPTLQNDTWSMDFMSDSLASGRRFRTLNIMDDFNRQVLAIKVGTSMPAQMVIRTLEELVQWRGKPKEIRTDNGPEFIATALQEWCETQGVRMKYIQPGKPTQNAYIERLNRLYREDVLDAYLFFTLNDVRKRTSTWVKDYNKNHPHKSLGGRSPINYAIHMNQYELFEEEFLI